MEFQPPMPFETHAKELLLESALALEQQQAALPVGGTDVERLVQATGPELSRGKQRTKKTNQKRERFMNGKAIELLF